MNTAQPIKYSSIQTFPTRRGFYAQINPDGSVSKEHAAGEYWNRHEIASHDNEADARAAHEHYTRYGLTIKECACGGAHEVSPSTVISFTPAEMELLKQAVSAKEQHCVTMRNKSSDVPFWDARLSAVEDLLTKIERTTSV